MIKWWIMGNNDAQTVVGLTKKSRNENHSNNFNIKFMNSCHDYHACL